MTPSIELPSRRSSIERFRSGGGRVAAVLPVHYPRALLRAHGILPVEVWGPPGADRTVGDAHLQAYTCSTVRCGLSFLLGGGANVADFFVVPHTCDSLQGLASVLLDFVRPRQAVLPLYIPKADRRCDIDFLAEELRRCAPRLAEVTGRHPSGEELLRAQAVEEEADEALGSLLDARKGLAVGNREFYSLVRTREYLPAEEFSTLARAALDRWSAAGAPKGRALLMSGIMPEPMEVMDALDDAGLRVVADDFSGIGRRRYRPGRSGEAYERMAAYVLSGPPDPTRGCAIAPRVDHLVSLARGAGAKGALFYEVKFCEPEAFHIPLVTRGLAEAGIPCLSVEADIGDTLPGQLVTRIEAFSESLA